LHEQSPKNNEDEQPVFSENKWGEAPSKTVQNFALHIWQGRSDPQRRYLSSADRPRVCSHECNVVFDRVKEKKEQKQKLWVV
jgi:hypothetical protein